MWSEMTSGQLTYAEEHAYSVAPVVQREPAIKSESRAFEARYNFVAQMLALAIHT